MAAGEGGYQYKLLLTILAFMFLKCNGQNPIVNTAAGHVRGSVVSGVSFFSAIPYGAPPTGNLRFEVPQKAAPWQGVFDATKQGNSCIQFFRSPGPPRSQPESEDCLSLDVYVPRDLSSREAYPATLLPVLIFIFDGGFVFGSRSDINATLKAKRENIIVVSINHRLGALGFLALDDSNIPGNIGLYDQRLAFQWVRENIRAFGGNPDKVVIYGKSSGSYSVSMHVLSPLSNGLFSGAIMGSGIYTDLLDTRANASWITIKVAATLGCDTSSSRTILSCLRNQDVRTLASAYTTRPNKNTVFVDGKFVVEQPIDALMCGRFNRVPVIAGFTSENGQPIANLFGSENGLSAVNLYGSEVIYNGISQNKIDTLIQGTVNITYPGHAEEEKWIAGNLTKAFYFNGDTSDRLVNLRSALDFARDIYWSAPAVKLAKYLSKVGVPVYLYEFDERILSNQGNPPAIPVGANFGDDSNFVWGDIEDAARFPLDRTPEKIQFSKDLSAAWSSFLRTGKPSLKNIRGQQLDWKAYTEDDPSYAHLKADVTSIKKGPASKADLVWNKVMGAVEDRKPKCSIMASLPSTRQSSWFWMYNWNPRGSWWGWWMSRS